VGIETSTVGAWHVLAADGELDAGVVPALSGVLADLIRAGAGGVVVDLSGVSLLSCGCVHVLVNAADRAVMSGVALRLAMNQAAGSMAQALGREPTIAELADRLEESVEDVRESMVAAQAYVPASLSQPVADGGTLVLGDLIGVPDEDLDRVDYHESLGPLVAALPELERQALAGRRPRCTGTSAGCASPPGSTPPAGHHRRNSSRPGRRTSSVRRPPTPRCRAGLLSCWTANQSGHHRSLW